MVEKQCTELGCDESVIDSATVARTENVVAVREGDNRTADEGAVVSWLGEMLILKMTSELPCDTAAVILAAICKTAA